MAVGCGGSGGASGGDGGASSQEGGSGSRDGGEHPDTGGGGSDGGKGADGSKPSELARAGSSTGPTRVGGYLGFDLPPNTTNEKAREIAKYLNKNIAAITLTY